MAFFKKRKKGFVDLTEQFKKQQEKVEEKKETESGNDFGFLGGLASASSSTEESSNYVDVSEGVQEKRRKLAKRLMDITNKMEDISNQIYHLQQRIELLERKLNVNHYE